MINMLRVLVNKVDNMQEQVSNVSSIMKILRKDQKEMLEIKSTVTEIKNAFDGLRKESLCLKICGSFKN